MHRYVFSLFICCLAGRDGFGCMDQTGIRQPVLPGIRKDKMTEKYPSFSDQIQ